MSAFEEYENALPAVARFILEDGREFLMSIESQDEKGNLQLGLIEGAPSMHRDDFARLATVVYLDELGRIARRMSKVAQPLQA